MKVKRYIGETVQDAMQRVKTELGRDAVIINTRKIKKKGLKGLFSRPVIEVVAAIDDNQIEINNEKKEPRRSTINYGKESLMAKPEQFKDHMNNLNELRRDRLNEADNIEKEFTEIKTMLSKVYKVINIKEENLSSITKEYIQRLRNQEVHEEILEKIKDKIDKFTEELKNNEDVIRDCIYDTLQDIITFNNGSIDATSKKVNVFIGPTGVGKTTTIAKLAALYTLTKKKTVGFITSDTYRIAAVEQLKTYSDIIGIPIAVVYSPSEFIAAVESFKDKDIIMVDTAGRCHKDKYQLGELKHLLDSGIDSQVYLVISTTTKMSDCLDILNSYNFLEDYKLLFTKLDETSSQGIIVNTSYFTKKPLSYLTFGQSVPDDIKLADTNKIINTLLGDRIYDGSSR